MTVVDERPCPSPTAALATVPPQRRRARDLKSTASLSPTSRGVQAAGPSRACTTTRRGQPIAGRAGGRRRSCASRPRRPLVQSRKVSPSNTAQGDEGGASGTARWATEFRPAAGQFTQQRKALGPKTRTRDARVAAPRTPQSPRASSDSRARWRRASDESRRVMMKQAAKGQQCAPAGTEIVQRRARVRAANPPDRPRGIGLSGMACASHAQGGRPASIDDTAA